MAESEDPTTPPVEGQDQDIVDFGAPEPDPKWDGKDRDGYFGGRPGPGRPKGSKDRFPRPWRAAMKAFFDECGGDLAERMAELAKSRSKKHYKLQLALMKAGNELHFAKAQRDDTSQTTFQVVFNNVPPGYDPLASKSLLLQRQLEEAKILEAQGQEIIEADQQASTPEAAELIAKELSPPSETLYDPSEDELYDGPPSGPPPRGRR